MLKSFKLIVTVIVLTASTFGAVAQTETYKDVLLNGKPAKLNTKTGEIVLVGSKSVQSKESKKDSTAQKTEIQSNLITKNTKTGVKDSTLVIVTKRPDTLAEYFKNQKVVVYNNSLQTERTVFTATRSDSITTTKTTNKTPELSTSEKAQKATTLVYDTSSSSTEDDTDSDYHMVKRGETLYALSKQYNVSLGELKRANNLETTLIKIGQNLRVRNLDELYNTNIWIVSKGDTLYSIAKKTNTTVAAIKTLNDLRSNLIKVGQKLQLK
ncbi:LysM peptidoglycan-binding domain-containing protein [uncultured Psychroserpens sp.]|uniref:LysM peptidoglycan-binding domain-containing protein n=1 Tax=uncultured Psychroserpens sp. TaxID=255436 RepID=UPI00263443AD|nr:LysM peptidoglycan-binding domain-containing protein [uncultured Psychroserpens sp.]